MLELVHCRLPMRKFCTRIEFTFYIKQTFSGYFFKNYVFYAVVTTKHTLKSSRKLMKKIYIKIIQINPFYIF